MSELWLKNEKVLTLKDDNATLKPVAITKIDKPELLPVFLSKECTIENLHEWLRLRCISDNREGIDKVRDEFGRTWENQRNYASLSDQYWIKKTSEKWGRINYFNNPYKSDVGDIFFKPWEVDHKINNNSPDLCTNGLLKKRWIQKTDKTSALVKAGSIATHQEPLSEVLVSVLCEQLNIIKSVKYDLHIEGVTMCSICDNFIDENTELVPASHFYFQEARPENVSIFSHLLKLCEKLDIPDVEPFIRGMIFIDTITGNTDRNMGNIAFLRNSKTMKFIGPAPLFDSGNAYWNSKDVNSKTKSKLFSDIEGQIFNSLKKNCDFEKLAKEAKYKKIINDYPCITDTKKENLIQEISSFYNAAYKKKTLNEMNR